MEGRHWDIVELLILNGADVIQEPNSDCFTILTLAAEEGLLKLVELLIDNGAVINTRETEMRISPLRQAAQNGYEEVVNMLIEHEAQINIFDAIGYTPLTIAVENGHFNIVKLLIAHNANVNAQDPYSAKKITPLIQAAQNGHTAIVAYLIDHGADVNLCSVFGSALYFAAQNNHTDVVEILLKAKACIGIICRETGWTPLLAAAGFGYTEMVKLLFAWGAKTFEQLHIALALAAANNRLQTCKYLIRQGANINSTLSIGDIKDKRLLDFAMTPEIREVMFVEHNKCSLELSHLCVKAIANNDKRYAMKDEEGVIKEVSQRGVLEYLRKKNLLQKFLDDCIICAKEDRVIMLTPCCYASICFSCWQNATTPQEHTHELVLDQQGLNRLIYRQEVIIGGKCPFCNKVINNIQ
jgi:ankyrin repeat protein